MRADADFWAGVLVAFACGVVLGIIICPSARADWRVDAVEAGIAFAQAEKPTGCDVSWFAATGDLADQMREENWAGLSFSWSCSFAIRPDQLRDAAHDGLCTLGYHETMHLAGVGHSDDPESPMNASPNRAPAPCRARGERIYTALDGAAIAAANRCNRLRKLRRPRARVRRCVRRADRAEAAAWNFEPGWVGGA